MVDELTGRLVFGGKDVLRELGFAPSMLLAQAKPLREGSDIQRVAYAILVAGVDGPDSGLASLDELLSRNDLPQADRDLAESVRVRLVAWKDGKTAAERALPAEQAERLGYFAAVLEGAAQPSAAAVYILGAFGAWYGLIGLGGFVLLLVMAILVALGLVRLRFGEASSHGVVYIETFAVWMLLFFGANLVLGAAIQALGWTNVGLAVAPLAFIGSLVALRWPVARGLPWSDVRQHIGWHSGRGLIAETAAGFATYAMALPLMLLGVLVFMLLSKLTGINPQPSHPAVEGIMDADPVGLAVLFFIACIAAPLVEETMFRGVLYRHLRDSTAKIGQVASVLVASVVSSVLFAAIHPQGFLFVPVLAGLAMGFCVAREWRGTLLPGIVAHAITNFITLSMNVALSML